MTGFGAFGVPGYAGIAASGLGWGEQEDFEEFKDPPATVENIRTRALSSHPSKPLFLVGSSNTHVYLWEVSYLTLKLFTCSLSIYLQILRCEKFMSVIYRP